MSASPVSFGEHLDRITSISPEYQVRKGPVLSSRLFVVSAWIPCTMGKENFPSERSSAKPLFVEY